MTERGLRTPCELRPRFRATSGFDPNVIPDVGGMVRAGADGLFVGRGEGPVRAALAPMVQKRLVADA